MVLNATANTTTVLSEALVEITKVTTSRASALPAFLIPVFAVGAIASLYHMHWRAKSDGDDGDALLGGIQLAAVRTPVAAAARAVELAEVVGRVVEEDAGRATSADPEAVAVL